MGGENKKIVTFAALAAVGSLGMAGLSLVPTYAAVNCPDGSTAETVEACGTTEEVAGSEDQAGPMGEGSNFAPLPNADEELVKLPVYQEAVASIATLNKTQALRAGLKSVDEQIPDWKLWDETIYGLHYAQGSLLNWNPRDGFGGDAGFEGFIGHIAQVFFNVDTSDPNVDKVTPEQREQIENAIKQMAPAGDLTMERAVAYAKTLPQYNSNAEFKTMVDTMDAHVQRGATILRKNLPLLDSSLTADDLATKTADELVVLTKALPKYLVYAQLWEAYNNASVLSKDYMVEAYSDTEENREALARLQTVGYGRLVLAAKQILPSFTVDLSGVEQLPLPAELPKASAPAVPDTGSVGSEGGSASIVTVALLGVTAVVGGAGIIYTAKRHLFSPLKRRKH